MNKEQFIQKLIDNNVKVYQTEDKGQSIFIKVENKNGAVITVSLPYDRRLAFEGVTLSAPIEPNYLTGSSVMITESNGYTSFEEALNIIENYRSICPVFFSLRDLETTKFQTIEQAVEQHGNILGFLKIK